MKNRIMIFLMVAASFALSSFQAKVKPMTAAIPSSSITGASNQDGLFGEQMSCAWITTLIHNGEELAKKFDRHIFCFHPDGLLEACNDLFCVQGTWEADQDIVQISMNATSVNADNANSHYDWLNGTWRIIERSENALELEKIGKDYWRVRFETITR